MTTIPQAFAAAVRRDSASPMLTWYDDASGDRTELSGATLDNWVAKTANMLVDGAGLDAGDAVAVLLPPHWQTAAVLLGTWSAGLVRVSEPQAAGAVFATPSTSGSAGGRAGGPLYASGVKSQAAPMRDDELPPRDRDHRGEVDNPR